MIDIRDGKNYIPEVKELITEYTNRLGRDLTFQHLEEELADPAKKYTAPEGELLVAVEAETGIVVGMVAYHRHTSKRCEMKRLYVTPRYRGDKLGERLIFQIMEHAGRAGYQEMVLDTIQPLKAAIHLYERFGFQPCAPYYDNPMEDVLYMKKDLENTVSQHSFLS